jgi:hypothetical protein
VIKVLASTILYIGPGSPLNPSTTLRGVDSSLNPKALAKGLEIKSLSDPESTKVIVDLLPFRVAIWTIISNFFF